MYVVSMAQYFATLSEVEVVALEDMRTGLSARCQFLPTQADCENLLAERAKRWGTLPDYSHIQRGEDRKPIVDHSERKAQPPIYVLDSRGNRRPWHPEDDEKFARMKAAATKANRMQAYALHLGNGNAERGWQIIMDGAIDEPPADFEVQA